MTLEKKLKQTIYSNDINCRGEHILTQYVNLPKFNYYSTTEKCKENPDFEYCQTWLNVDIDEEEFNQALNDYQTEINNNQKSTKKENWLVTLFGENYQIMISLISISVVILIVYFVGGKRRQR